MTTIKFDKSVKYNGVRYAAHEAFKVANEEVEDLKKAGAIVLSVEEEAPAAQPELGSTDSSNEEEEVDNSKLKEELLEFTVPELIKFAEERGIDLQKKTKKAEIYNIIVAALD